MTEPTGAAVRGRTRLTALHDTRLLDTPPDEGFDRLTRLAARVLRAPIALMTLIDEDRQFFKSAVGLPEPWASTHEAPLSYGYSAETLARGEPLLISDARTDPIGRSHQHLTDFGMVAYAGVPLINLDGEPIGTFEVMDSEPRAWTRDDLDTLLDLAASARIEIELRQATQRNAAAASRARFLAEAGDVLASSLDYRATLSRVAHLAVPVIADYCVVDVLEDDDHLVRVAAVHADPAQQASLDQLPQLPVGSLAPGRPIELQSSVIVPLAARGRVVGAFTFGMTSATRHLTPDDRALAQELARRAAFAVENARLVELARQAARMREELVAIVSHDLKNPLSVIQTSASFVLEDLLPPGQETDAVREQVVVMRRAADRMYRLIGTLLDASAIEAGRLVVKPDAERADTVVRDAIEAIEPLARAKSIRIESSLPREPLQVMADRDRILQVFANLCGNAVKFTPRGGTVTLGVQAGDAPAQVRFWVSDTGPGIPPEDQPHVFDRFWRGQRGTSPGTGLGLTIARGIVEAHGGRIWLESTPGKGTTFFFSLPAASDWEAAAQNRRQQTVGH